MSKYDSAERTVAQARIIASREWFDGSPLPDGPTGLTAGEAARKILRGEDSA